jgi:hypothetical protein
LSSIYGRNFLLINIFEAEVIFRNLKSLFLYTVFKEVYLRLVGIWDLPSDIAQECTPGISFFDLDLKSLNIFLDEKSRPGQFLCTETCGMVAG